MKPITFPEVNVQIAKDQPEYNQLPSYVNLKQGLIVNCFELDNEDIINITRHQKIWIHHIARQLQPFGLVAVNDYFASVGHQDGKYVIMNEDDQVKQVEAVVNASGIITPMQNLKRYFNDKHGLSLYDYELEDIINMVKKV